MSAASLYLLDTNITGYIVNGRSLTARAKLKEAFAGGKVIISTITEAEIRYGLPRRSQATRLRASVEALLDTLQIKPWDSAAAEAYGALRAALNTAGNNLALMDLLIASHAIACDAILVSHDPAFSRASTFLTVVDWATDL